jgi:putative sterol carrier protein
MAESVREFLEGIPDRVDAERVRRLEGSYRFDIEGVASWRMEAEGDRVVVTESDAPADCVIRASEQTFLRIVNGEQSAMGAYMTGKVRVEGDLGLALQLRDVFA